MSHNHQNTESSSPSERQRSSLIEQVLLDYLQQETIGDEIDEAELVARYPNLMPELAERLQLLREVADERAANVRPKAESLGLPGPLAGDSGELHIDRLLQEISPLGTTDLGTPQFAPGTRLADRYRVVALLGRGGMGEVYRTDDLKLGQSVALKFLPVEFASDPLSRDRLMGEIRTARQVTHVNVCRIHDLDEANGQIFLTMEFVDGEDLSRLIQRLGRVGNEKANDIAIQIGLGLLAVHEAGVIHRDLKPANIMIDARGRVRLLDFGLAGIQRELSGEHSIAGTPGYMAPELFSGEEPTVRSDIYALGLTLYELYTGYRAFDTSDFDVLTHLHTSTTPPLPSSLVPDIEATVERTIMCCLEKNPQDRPQSVADVLAGLRGSWHDEPTDPVRRDERKQVTVMFGGFQSEADSMDPEMERDAIDDGLEKLIPIVKKYEGTVEKSIGDEIVILFGVPVAHEDDAERALRAALEMMEALSTFNAESGNNLSLRIGLNTGLVIAGGGSTRPLASGDVVRIASRLQERSEPGEILVGANTHRLTARLFEFEALEPIAGKGNKEPTAVHRLLSAKSVPRRTRGTGDIGALLVGRDTECRDLGDAIDRVHSGVGGVVTLVGEAGLGKSRLVAELQEQVLARSCDIIHDHAATASHPGPRWVEGRCLSFGGSVAYLLWLDVLRRLLGVDAEDPSQAIREALHSHVNAVCPDDFDDVFPHLARLFSLPLADDVEARLRGLGAQGLKAGTFRAFQTLLERTARRQAPLIVVCEDLHWADPTSLELLEQLFTLIDQVPLLFICLFRPETEHGCGRIRVTATRDYHHCHTDLLLEPLSAAASQRLVDSLLRVDDLPHGLGERILEHAEGNPFYIEEIVRSLIAAEAIVWDHGAGGWNAVQTVSDIDIPDTLSGVLTARIDCLEQETKRSLQLAAVIGRTFYFRVLEAIANKGRDLESDLLTLQRQQMIRERTRLPEREYIFKHQLTQAAAYESLLKKERRIVHRQVAETLEQLYAIRVEELLELLAHHWERAEETEKAVSYLFRAGQKAANRYANVEALALFDHALTVAEGSDTCDDILASRAKIRLEMFQGKEAVEDYEQLLDRARNGGNRESELESLLGLASALYEIALSEPAMASESLKRYESAFTLADQLNHKAGMVQSLLASRWLTDFLPDHWERATADIERAWAISQDTKDETLVFECMIAKANADLISIDDVEELLEQLKSRHDLLQIHRVTFRLSWRHLFAGQFHRAIEGCKSSIALADKLGMPPVMYATMRSLALLELGQYDGAWESLQQEIADKHNPLGQAFKGFGEGMRFLELMDYEQAIDTFEGVIQQAKQVGRAWLQLWAEERLSMSQFKNGHRDRMNLKWIDHDLAHTPSTILAAAPLHLGEIALDAQELDEALRLATQSGADAEAQGWRPCQLIALELRLRVLLRLGRPTDVISLADRGLEMAHAMENRPMIWRVGAAKAQALAILGHSGRAAQQYEASAAVIRELAKTIGDPQLKHGFLSSTSIAKVLEHD